MNKAPAFINTVKDEDGAALILSLILMSVLTILAVTSVNTTTTEYKIVRNERIFLDNFNKAESAAREGLQALDIADTAALNNRSFDSFAWLKQKDDTVDMTDVSVWTAANSSSASVSDADYAVSETGISKGGSLDMTATSSIYDYISRGYGHSGNGNTLIEIGYKMRH